MIGVTKLRKSVANDLARVVGPAGVVTSGLMRILYGRDLATRTTMQLRDGNLEFPPDAIVWPETVEQVAKIVEVAAKHHIPVIPYGGGSGVCGGTLPIKGGIIIDLKKMKRVISIDEKTLSAEIESGIVGMELERQLNDRGFSMGHFPASILCATLGGYLATRSAGQLSSRYGNIDNMVLDVEAVLPDGSIKPFGKPIDAYKKINPIHILIGSEGTLGIITKVKVKIHPLPSQMRLRGLSFNKIEGALGAMRTILQMGIRPSVMRLYDPLDSLLLQMGYESGAKEPSKLVDSLEALVSEYLPMVSGLKMYSFKNAVRFPKILNGVLSKISTDVILILGFEGESDWISIEDRISADVSKRFISRDLGQGPGHHWLKHRYSVSYKMPTIFNYGCFVDTIEVAATWDKIGKLYKEVRKTVGKHALVLAHFSHAYHEGCSIYFTFVGYGGGGEKDFLLYDKIWNETLAKTIECGGCISHHHGVGILKADFMERELGPMMPILKQMKNKLDPLNIMNPGKLGLG